MLLSVCAIFVAILLIVIQHLFSWSSEERRIPGIKPRNLREGNKPDIAAAGSMHVFLRELHGKYGPITSFWYGPKYMVSIASPELFKEHHMACQRPSDTFAMMRLLFGSNAIQFASSNDAQRRREIYDHGFSHEIITHFYATFNKVAVETVRALSALPKGSHVPLVHHCLGMSAKGIGRTSFGNYFEDDGEIDHFREVYGACWTQMELAQVEGLPEAGSARDTEFKTNVAFLKSLVRDMIKRRRDKPSQGEYQVFIDILLEDELPERQIQDDCMSFLIGGFQTVGILTSWAIYFLAAHQDCQEKLYRNVTEVLGDGDVDASNHEKLRYVQQVINETLRLSVLATYTSRYQDEDVTLGSYKVPAKTQVIQAIGVVLEDPELWPEPDKFDPERFEAHHHLTSRHKHAFKPFGFAGKRDCPGQHFAQQEATVFLAILCRAFKFQLVDGQVVKWNYGILTRPSDEVWVTVEKRH